MFWYFSRHSQKIMKLYQKILSWSISRETSSRSKNIQGGSSPTMISERGVNPLLQQNGSKTWWFISHYDFRMGHCIAKRSTKLERLKEGGSFFILNFEWGRQPIDTISLDQATFSPYNFQMNVSICQVLYISLQFNAAGHWTSLFLFEGENYNLERKLSKINFPLFLARIFLSSIIFSLL